MAEVSNRYEWIFENCSDMLKDKEQLFRHLVFQMLNKTTKIFKYNGLPDTIQVKDLETQLQMGGFAIWKEVGGKLYTFRGGLGGRPNEYYLPTTAIIANPYLNYSASLEIDKECVVMLNDYYYQGLMPLFNKYGRMLVEAEISLKYAIINSRIPSLVQADNDNTYKSAQDFFKKIEDGSDFGIITSREFLDGIKTHDFFKETYIKSLIEAIHYIKGSWYNEIGLNSTFNMKREAINEAEASLNEDILIPSVDTMLKCRQDALEKVNKMYGTNITVELDSVWANNRKLDDLQNKLVQAEINNLNNEDGNNEDKGNTDTTGQE